MRKPRSDDPEKWVIYNQVRGGGKREKRRRKTTNQVHQLNLIDAGLVGAPNEVK